MKRYAALAIALPLLACIHLQAKKTQSFRSGVWTPQNEQTGFEVPEGFVVELVASEQNGIVNPIDITFDDAGRLWTQTASMYPLDPFSEVSFGEIRKLMEDPDLMAQNQEFQRIRALYEGKIKGADRILVIDDPWAEKPSNPKVWAEGLAIPQSILPYKNGAYVAQGSELIFLEDRDGNGTADKRATLLKGFGFTDTHTMAHLLIRAPGNWIHFSHGALNKGLVESTLSGATARIDYSKIVRMSMDGARFNVVSSGLNNIWGFQLRANGQWFGTEANDMSWSVIPMEPGTGLSGIGGERIRPYQPWIPQLHDFRVGGTGISGLEFSEDGTSGFPSEWKDVAFLANPITNTINCVRIVRNPDGSVSAEHLPDLLTSQDDWFRPVNLEFGPDGCLYVADWYNKIVSHNEVPRSHPDRDKSHGRIWRIRHESQQPGKIPNLYETPTKELATHLTAPTLWEKRAAWHQIAERKARELAPQLVELAADSEADPITRIHALWSLESIQYFDTQLMESLTQDPNDDLRREAIRSLASFDLQIPQMASYLKDLIADPNAMVRSQALRTLIEFGKANNEIIHIIVSFCRPLLPGDNMGGPYERKFERYLARMALEQYEPELVRYLESPQAANQPSDNLFWAIQALSRENHEKYFITLYDSINNKDWDTSTFIEVANGLENPAIRKVVAPYFENPKNARNLITKANEVLGQIDSRALKSILNHAVRQMLSSSDAADQIIGLQAVAGYRIPGFEETIVQLLNAPQSKATIQTRAVSALQHASKPSTLTALEQVLTNQSLNFNARLAAFDILLKAKHQTDPKSLEVFLNSLDNIQRNEFIKTLSMSKAGSNALVQLLNNGTLSIDQIGTTELARIVKSTSESKQFGAVVEKRITEKSTALQKTKKTFLDIAEAGGGDPLLGKPLFSGICLSCHSVGSEGIGWAPALDGSGYRDNEALITAILDPSAASETAYRLNRIRKTDGSVIEGFLETEDSRGITLRFMGGASLFIPANEIEGSPERLPQSAMPEGLINNMPHDQVANLLAYIRSLK